MMTRRTTRPGRKRARKPRPASRPDRSRRPGCSGRRLYYLERYSASSAQLHKVLARKVETRLRLRGEADDPQIAGPARALIAGVVEQAVSGGYVDDAAYLRRARAEPCAGRGGSHRAHGEAARKGLIRP